MDTKFAFAFVHSMRFVWVPCTVHETRKYIFLTKTTLKLGSTILFTHLKIILLQCFQFSVINGVQHRGAQTQIRPWI